MHPLEFVTANTAMAAVGILTAGAGFSIIAGACGGDGPLALATCLPGLGLGGAVVASGAGDLWLSYHFFTQQTLPAFGSWG